MHAAHFPAQRQNTCAAAYAPQSARCSRLSDAQGSHVSHAVLRGNGRSVGAIDHRRLVDAVELPRDDHAVPEAGRDLFTAQSGVHEL